MVSFALSLVYVVSSPGTNNFYQEPQGFKFLAGLASLAGTVVVQRTTTGLKSMYTALHIVFVTFLF